MRIAEVARRSGVSSSALRFYESEGLIVAERGANGYRDYGDDVLDRLAFIQSAKHLDLSLPEIAELLRVVGTESCTEVRETVRPKLEERLRELDLRLAGLQRLRERLVRATDEVSACPDSGERCRTQCALHHRDLADLISPTRGLKSAP